MIDDQWVFAFAVANIMLLPVALETAALLAALVNPNHLGQLSSRDFTHLPPSCISNDFGYSTLIKLTQLAANYAIHRQYKSELFVHFCRHSVEQRVL